MTTESHNHSAGASDEMSLVLVNSNNTPTKSSSSSFNVMVDALPYFDRGYDEPGVQQAAMALINEEMRRYRPTKNYLEYLGDALPSNAFDTELMRAELERLNARQPMELLNTRRYELPPPPTGKMTDVKAWQEALLNAQAQLEHQATRIQNLELMTQYGTNAWKVYNATLEKMLYKAEMELHEVKRKIQEINWNRKREQTEAGEKLKTLEETWVGLVGKNYEIELALVKLDNDIQHLRQK